MADSQKSFNKIILSLLFLEYQLEFSTVFTSARKTCFYTHCVRQIVYFKRRHSHVLFINELHAIDDFKLLHYFKIKSV